VVNENGLTINFNGGYGGDGANGVSIGAAYLNDIGDAGNEGNVISANTLAGVLLSGATQNTVAGNYIGTDATGTLEVSNGLDGVLIADLASNNMIGGTVPGAGNLISNNGSDTDPDHYGYGIEVDSAGNFFDWNYIGWDVTGTVVLANKSGAENDTSGGQNSWGDNTGDHNLYQP